MQAVWAWIQLQLAVGLLEHWATSTEASQVGTVAHPFALSLLLFMLAAVLVRLCHASSMCGTAEFPVVCTAMHRARFTGCVLHVQQCSSDSFGSTAAYHSLRSAFVC